MLNKFVERATAPPTDNDFKSCRALYAKLHALAGDTSAKRCGNKAMCSRAATIHYEHVILQITVSLPAMMQRCHYTSPAR